MIIQSWMINQIIPPKLKTDSANETAPVLDPATVWTALASLTEQCTIDIAEAAWDSKWKREKSCNWH